MELKKIKYVRENFYIYWKKKIQTMLISNYDYEFMKDEYNNMLKLVKADDEFKKLLNSEKEEVLEVILKQLTTDWDKSKPKDVKDFKYPIPIYDFSTWIKDRGTVY